MYQKCKQQLTCSMQVQATDAITVSIWTDIIVMLCKVAQVSRPLQIILEDDLVDACKPGGRISVVGVYKAMAPRASGTISGVFKAVVVGNSVQQLSKEADRNLTADDIRCVSDLTGSS